MGLKVSHINIFSPKPNEVSHFFSELLDMDITPEKSGDGIWVENDFLKLFVGNANADQLFHTSGERDIFLEITMDTLNELEDLVHKVQFLDYRRLSEKDERPSGKAKLSKVGEKIFFNLKDPDGRKWKFSYNS